MTLKQFQFVVTRAGTRLDKFVSENVPGISRTQAQHLIEDGFVTVNGNTGKASNRLSIGDKVEAKIVPPPPSHLKPEDISVPILYEDDDVLVVDKPAGLTVHPAPGYTGPTLVHAVLSHLSKFVDDVERPGIVHRLDKDTSGVMVVAKNPAALSNLSAQFKKRTVSKVYLALVKGHLIPEEGIIEAPIGRDSGDREKMAITSESRGRQARTNYRVIKYAGDYTYLAVKPETGRTHQIRVHLAAIGYPVVGDATYGIKSYLLSRQFLHAHKLSFHLPSSGKRVEFESPLPADLESALKAIG